MTDRSMAVALFFTRGLSLQRWQKLGMLEREVAIYRRLVENGNRVVFVTYGDEQELDFNNQLGGIEICCNARRLPAFLYAMTLPWLHRRALKSCDVFKTNQTNGGEIALTAARRLGKPLIARCGYMWSFVDARKRGEGSKHHRRALKVEGRVFPRASRIVVTTHEMAADVRQRFPQVSERIRVIPNYVDTDRFSPTAATTTGGRYDVLYVGRFAPQKNLQALLEAVAPLPIRVGMVGDGPLVGELQSVPTGQARIEWLGRRPHAELPGLMANANAFVLPSFFEGHPKAMIEAMACGTPVIGTDVPGIGNLLKHEQTGLLCQTEMTSLRAAIQRLLGDEALRTRLGHAGRAEAERLFSLDGVFATECSVLREAIAYGR